MSNISKKEQVKVGSIWVTPTNVEFKVKDVNIVEDQTWVYYYKISTGQEYSCLKDAFTNRFHERVNNG